MKNYAVVANIKAEQKGIIDDVFDKGYEQGYKDGTKVKDGERGSIYYRGYGDGIKDGYEKGLKHVQELKENEKKAEYKRGYEQGRRSTITIKDFEEYYHKGLKHGQELRAKEAECAEACGMKRAWEAARKIYDIQNVAMVKELFGADANYTIHNFTASEVIEKIEAWEKEQEENEKVDCNNTNCKNCINHNDCDYEDEWKLRRRGIVPAPPKEKQDAPETNVESIAVWDEVEDNLGNRMVVTHIYSDGKYANADVIDTDGRCFSCMPLELFEKTGRRFCFQELLDAMKKSDMEEGDTNADK